MYYTNEDFERFYLKYKSEGIAANESMQSFCDRHIVPFNLFHKWYKDTRVRLVEVEVTDRHSGISDSRTPEHEGTFTTTKQDKMISTVTIKVSNGLSLH